MQEKIASLPRVGDTLRIDAARMQQVMDLLQAKQTVHKESGGTHAILLFDPAWKMLSFAEDIGRHNALDKAIGKCVLAGVSLKGCGAVLSGRVSFEMTSKCGMAGIEVILAVSAPTSLALTAASQCGITVCAFVRNHGATLYTHPHRISRS
jgi:FdhD protein